MASYSRGLLPGKKKRGVNAVGRPPRPHCCRPFPFPSSPPPAPQGSPRAGQFGSPDRRVTDTLLFANCLAFLAQAASGQRVTVWGAKINAAIAAGELWRLATPALLHGNLVHLATNQFALNSLGPLIERLSGRKRFIAIYTAAAVAGTAASYAFTVAPSVGASGAIFGLGGALAVFFVRHRSYFGKASDAVLASLGQSLAINVVMGLVTANVDNWGHAGGLAGGALTAWLLGPRLVVDAGAVPPVARDRPPVPLLAAAPVVIGQRRRQ